MFELSVAVRTHNQKVSRVVANVRIEVVYLEVRLAVSFFEGERTKLAPSIMHFAKQDANTRRDNLVPLGDVREYRRTQSGC